MSIRSRSACLLLGAVASVAALASAAPQPADPNRALAEAQLKLVRNALDDLDKLFKSGQAGRTDLAVSLWERRQVEALRATGASKEVLVAALEGYLKRMKQFEQVHEEAYKSGQLAHPDLLDAKYRALEAEIWLNQEKAR